MKEKQNLVAAALVVLMATGVKAAATIDELDAWQISQEAIPNRWDRTC